MATDYGADAIIFKQSSNHVIKNNFIHLRHNVPHSTDADSMLAI